MPGTEIPDIFSERQPYIEVDSVGGQFFPFPLAR